MTTGEGRFADSVRSQANELWEQSFRHPFVAELANGTLPEEKFAHYVKNDSFYLTVFAQVQAQAAAKAADLPTIGRFAAHAQSTVEAEHALHETFFGMLGIAREDHFLPAPTAYQYAAHLQAVAARGSLGEVVAAILPCYWLYWEIGERYRDAKPNHPIYDRWIATYSGTWFGELVAEQVDRLNQLAAAASAQERERMARWFLISSEYELAFWEMAYTLEAWRFAGQSTSDGASAASRGSGGHRG
ncbi:MAG: thiaminase II [Alicyclobacillus sp.]|nr:thiaminase II [Alicyclobacillus sp.]